MAADGEDTTAKQGSYLGISSPGGGDGGGDTAGDRNLRSPFPKHFCAIYCNKNNYGTVSGSRAFSRGAGFKVVVGAGEHQSGGEMVGGAGGRGGKVLRGVVRIEDLGIVRILRQVIM